MSILDNIVFIFPGQGSQYPGIGQDLFYRYALVRQTYEEASDVLGYDMRKLSFETPGDQINQTRYTQPVVLTHSIACYRIFKKLTNGTIIPKAAAGHSLGEYSALVCAKSLNFDIALTLVKKRGELMGQYGGGEMEALMIDIESAKSIAENHYCSLAACNLLEQNVVGGKTEDLNAIVSTISAQFSHKKIHARLKTEGAFHTYYMVEAAKHFRPILNQTSFHTPKIQVLSNFTGRTHDPDIDKIKSKLFFQLFHPVMWYKNLKESDDKHGAKLFIEFGGGLGKSDYPSGKKPTLGSIVKKTFREKKHPPDYLSVINLKTLEESVSRFI